MDKKGGRKKKKDREKFRCLLAHPLVHIPTTAAQAADISRIFRFCVS